MGRAAGRGYRVEVVDAMRRSILPGSDWRAYRQLLRRFEEIRPDVVHTHSSKAGILGRYAARAARVPLVVHTIHGLAFTASTRPAVNAFYKVAERRAARRCDVIVCVADAMRDASLAAGVGRPGQYVTVYSGMDTAPFVRPPVPRDDARRALGLEPHHVAVGTIARLFDLKGHDDLIALAPSLCAAHPDLRFLWVGDGSLRRRFEAQISDLGLRGRFILTGLVSPTRVPELANAMDILVHPSRREGLARALPQGSLAGRPVVAYDVDGNREAIVEGETGYAVRPFDVAALGRHVSDLAADPDRRRAMGEAGRAFALGRFDASVMVAALDRVYAVGLSPDHSVATQLDCDSPQ